MNETELYSKNEMLKGSMRTILITILVKVEMRAIGSFSQRNIPLKEKNPCIIGKFLRSLRL